MIQSLLYLETAANTIPLMSYNSKQISLNSALTLEGFRFENFVIEDLVDFLHRQAYHGYKDTSDC